MEELQEVLLQDNADQKKNDTLSSFMPYLRALEQAQNPQLDEIYSLGITQYERFMALGLEPLLDQAAYYEENAQSQQGLELLQELEQRNFRYLPHYFRASQQLMTPKELYNKFGGTLLSKLKSKFSKGDVKRNQQLMETLLRQIMSADRVVYEVSWDASGGRQQSSWEMLAADKIAAAWDPRWLDWFIEQDWPELASAFARHDHPGVRSYLLKKIQEQGKRRSHDFLTTLFKGLERAGISEPERQELLMFTLENNTDYNPYVFHYYLFDLMLRFPAGYISRIEAVLPNYRYECKTQLEYLLNYLRSRRIESVT
jgi:hypothetical protein